MSCKVVNQRKYINMNSYRADRMEVTNSSCVLVGLFSLHVNGVAHMWMCMMHVVVCLCTAEARGGWRERSTSFLEAALGVMAVEMETGRAEMPVHKWLLTGCSLTSRAKSAATSCLYFSGNTQQCMFRMAMRLANSGSLMIRGGCEKFTCHRE